MVPEIQAILNDTYEVHRPPDIAHLRTEERIQAVVTGGGTGLPVDWFTRLPNLRLIAINGVGTDQVDLEHARERDIHVTTTPGVLTDDVADIAVGLMIAVLRQIVAGHHMVRERYWAGGAKLPLGHSLRGRNLGVLGLGQIGRALAERSEAFGMNIAYYNRSDVLVTDSWTRCTTPVELAERCDVLVVCLASTVATENLVGREVLDALGPSGIVINVARGNIVDERELIKALSDGRIAGAGIDVFRDEPEIKTDFNRLDNVVLSPHQGSATVETRRAMGKIVLANLAAFYAGNRPPTSVI